MISPTTVKTIGIAALLVLLCLLMIPASDGNFLKPNNIENLISRTSMFGILAIGVAFVIISSGIDLSIGSIVCLIACLTAMFLKVDYPAQDVVKIGFASQPQKSIVLRGNVEQFSVGDTIRYFGSARSHSLVTKVESVRTTHGYIDGETFKEDAGKGIDVTILELAKAPSHSDQVGLVALAHPFELLDAEGATPSEVRLRWTGDGASEIRARDKVLLVDVNSDDMNEAKVSSVDGDQIVLSATLNFKPEAELSAIHLPRRPRMSIPVALLAVTSIAVGLGLLHGVLVAFVKLQPFIVTLCGLLIYRGAARWLVGDDSEGFHGEYTETLSVLVKGKLMLFENFGIPYPAFVLLLVAAIAIVFLNFTVWGRYLQAMGRNEEAAKYSGIRTTWITVTAYVIGVVSAALGGVLFALEYDSISPNGFGASFELYAIAAAVLGGCSLRGGEGSVIGVVLGTAVLQVLNNMIVLAGISNTLEFAVIGAVILLGVLVDEIGRRILAAHRSKQPAT